MCVYEYNFPCILNLAKLEIQLCVEDPEEVNENKLIGHFMHETIKDEDFIFRVSSIEVNNYNYYRYLLLK